MTPTFNDAIGWTSEWMKENRPELKIYNVFMWYSDLFQYRVIERKDGVMAFDKFCLTIHEKIFSFPIPSTKEDLFTILQILDKP